MNKFDEFDDIDALKELNDKITVYNRLKFFAKLFNLDEDLCSLEDFIIEYDNYPTKDTFIEDMKEEMTKYAKFIKGQNYDSGRDL